MDNDKEMLDFMIFHSARVIHTHDDDYCHVEWGDRDGYYFTGDYDSGREAICAAMLGTFFER